MPCWPVRPHPLPDELCSSWLVRVAAANGIKLGTFLHVVANRPRAFGQDLDRYVPPDLAAALAAGTGVPAIDLQRLGLCTWQGTVFHRFALRGNTPWILPVGTFHSLRRRRGLQYCPACLDADPQPYFRRIWRLGCAVGCASHRIQLVDACPVCAAPVAYHRSTIGDRRQFRPTPITVCTACGADLRNAPHTALSERLHAFTRSLLPALLGRHRTVATSVGRLPTVELLAVLRQFTRLLAHGRWGRPVRQAALSVGARLPIVVVEASGAFILEHASVETRTALLEAALQLFERWPASFSRLCAMHGVWQSSLMADFRHAPTWYRRRVHEDLFSPGANLPPGTAS